MVATLGLPRLRGIVNVDRALASVPEGANRCVTSTFAVGRPRFPALTRARREPCVVVVVVLVGDERLYGRG